MDVHLLITHSDWPKREKKYNQRYCDIIIEDKDIIKYLLMYFY